MTGTSRGGPQSLREEFFRVEREPTLTVIPVKRIEWDGPHTPVASWHRVSFLPANAGAVAVEEAVLSVLQDEEFFQVCETCNERNPVGWMHGPRLCQGCAEKYEGVVY